MKYKTNDNSFFEITMEDAVQHDIQLHGYNAHTNEYNKRIETQARVLDSLMIK